jgi:lantibiotic modifying enzyme
VESASGLEQEPLADEIERPGCVEVIAQIVAHITTVTTYERHDRLFPADPKLFVTNPLSLAYGACGVAYALHRIERRIPQAMLDWILSKKLTLDAYPPGLYLGLSGIGLTLLDMGARQEAERIFRMTFNHPLLHSAANVFYGTAGWGMASLRFFMNTGDELYLDKARSAGDQLIQTGRNAAAGLCWDHPNEMSVGFAHGASGIAAFLLYLSLATRDERYLHVAQQGLEFDLAHAHETKDGGLSWPHLVGSESPLYPYWQYGSAGVGSSLLRFYRLMKEEKHRRILEKIFVDVDRNFAAIPGRFLGLAGLGDFLLDMHEFSGEQRFMESAQRVAAGIMQFRVERDGIAFPGDFLARLCCDFGTGSAGIALFLNRLLGRQSSDFMLDDLFEMPSAGISVAGRGKALSLPSANAGM